MKDPSQLMVLVADDDPGVRDMLRSCLKILGVGEIYEASDGAEALQAIREHPGITFVILDWEMPVMSGLEFLREMRRETAGANIFVMMLTGRSEQANVMTAVAEGVNGYMVKPISFRTLSERLAKVLGVGGQNSGQRFGEFLVQNGVISRDQRDVALECQRRLDVSHHDIGTQALISGFCGATEVLVRFREVLGQKWDDATSALGQLDSHAFWTEMLGAKRYHELEMANEAHRLRIGETLVGLGVLTPARLELLLEKFRLQRR